MGENRIGMVRMNRMSMFGTGASETARAGVASRAFLNERVYETEDGEFVMRRDGWENWLGDRVDDHLVASWMREHGVGVVVRETA